MIRFDDGAAYERSMGVWSRLAGERFLDWLAPPRGWRWLDVGCGNGAFTELLIDRCAPAAVHGIDPSEAQLAYARNRPAIRSASLSQADAMAIPCPSDSVDAAVMALVIVFVADPARALAEMIRVVRPGGWVVAYVWDMPGGGFPFEPILGEMRAMGLTPPVPPRTEIAGIDALGGLWRDAGLDAVDTRAIVVQRRFASFEAFWANSLASATLGPLAATLASGELESLKSRVRARVSAADGGHGGHTARAHAVRGRVRGR